MAKELPAAIKDLLVLVVVFGVILGGLYAFTGVWPPAVIVESGSMMHRDTDVSYGRFGTIDPGDMVLVKNVDSADDVTTWADGGRDRYGAPGDVIVYYPLNNTERTPIIHRAMAWVDVDDASSDARYRVRWSEEIPCPDTGTRSDDGEACVWGNEGITVGAFGVFNYKPDADGFITKGDNPFSNPRADQTSGLSTIVRADWIQGKSRAEIPWLGLIKLAIADQPNERNPPASWVKVGNAYAPQDLWVMLGVSLFVLVGIPVGYDAWKALEDKKKRAVRAGTPPPADVESAPEHPPADEPEDAPSPPPESPVGDADAPREDSRFG